MEKHAAELTQNLVAYLNADSSGKGKFAVGGSHSLEAFVREVSRDIADPVTGKPLMDALIAHDDALGKIPSGGEFRIDALGSGSDYTPFLQHLGVASLDIRFAAEDSGIYHSVYDDFNWYSHFSDTTFVYGRTLSQVHLTALMRLADAPVLPFEFGRLAATVSRYLDEIEKPPVSGPRPDLSSVRGEISRVQKNAAAFDAAYARALPRLASASSASLAAIDRILLQTERRLRSQDFAWHP
jgi:N-acetylated-alpha-linked acidic dipeptidase